MVLLVFEACTQVHGRWPPSSGRGSGGADAWDLSRVVWLPRISCIVAVTLDRHGVPSIVGTSTTTTKAFLSGSRSHFQRNLSRWPWLNEQAAREQLTVRIHHSAQCPRPVVAEPEEEVYGSGQASCRSLGRSGVTALRAAPQWAASLSSPAGAVGCGGRGSGLCCSLLPPEPRPRAGGERRTRRGRRSGTSGIQLCDMRFPRNAPNCFVSETVLGWREELAMPGCCCAVQMARR